jgi:hypothetical protein
MIGSPFLGRVVHHIQCGGWRRLGGETPSKPPPIPV